MPAETLGSEDVQQSQEVEATSKGLSEFLADRMKTNDQAEPKAGAEVEETHDNPPVDDKATEPKLDKDGNPIVEKPMVDAEGKEGEAKSGDKTGKDAEGDVGVIEEGKPVPYDRFKEVNDQKAEYQHKYEEVLPKVENFDKISNFCRESDITPDQFEQVMRVQALLNTNPEEALKHLEPIVDQLKGLVGNKLPDDLQKKVDGGKIELADAQEIAKLRAKAIMTEQSGKRREQMMQARVQQQYKEQITKSTAAFETQKRATDPDYRPKKSDSEPDGLWENTRDKYLAWLNLQDGRGQFINKVETAEQLVALMEKAYKAAKAIGSGVRAPATRPRLGSNGSRTGSSGPRRVEDAKNMAEAIEIQLENRK